MNISVSLYCMVFIIGCHCSFSLGQDDFRMEEVLVEEWNAIVESSHSSHLKVKVFRKSFENERFDISDFIRALKKAHGAKKTQEFLSAKRDEILGNVTNVTPYWGYTAEVWHSGVRSRVCWACDNDKTIAETVFDSRGVAERLIGLGQVQITNESSAERLRLTELLFIPKFKSAVDLEIVETERVDELLVSMIDGDDELLFVKTKNSAYTLAVDSTTNFVTASVSKQGHTNLYRFTLGEVAIENLDTCRPEVDCRISFDANNQPKFLNITLFEACDVNSRINKQNLAMRVAQGTKVIDLRNGLGKPKVLVPRDNHDSLFEFLKTHGSPKKSDCEAEPRASDKNKINASFSHRIIGSQSISVGKTKNPEKLTTSVLFGVSLTAALFTFLSLGRGEE